jgi:sulfite exporter TauE/SafE
MSLFVLPLALFLGGLASGLHCAGMCGGISAGFSLVQKQQLWRRQLAFNAGRITSYAVAGAAAGALGSAGAYIAAVLPAQILLYLFSSAFVLAAGVHLTGFALPLTSLERIGLPVWRRLQPIAARLLPARTLPQAYAAGLAWGWLPCGLVYGAVLAAVFAGGAAA